MSLNIIEHPTPKFCQCRNGLWARTNTITYVTLIFVTRWSKLMLGTSQHPIQRLSKDVSLGMKPHASEGGN